MDEPSIFTRYHALKAETSGSLLLVRVGDFYEAFGDDATIIAKAIGLTLTSRDVAHGKRGTPMCGFPYHSLENYLGKLVAAGHRVAIGEAV